MDQMSYAAIWHKIDENTKLEKNMKYLVGNNQQWQLALWTGSNWYFGGLFQPKLKNVTHYAIIMAPDKHFI